MLSKIRLEIEVRKNWFSDLTRVTRVYNELFFLQFRGASDAMSQTIGVWYRCQRHAVREKSQGRNGPLTLGHQEAQTQGRASLHRIKVMANAQCFIKTLFVNSLKFAFAMPGFLFTLKKPRALKYPTTTNQL